MDSKDKVQDLKRQVIKVLRSYDEPSYSVRQRVGRYEHFIRAGNIVDAMLVVGSEEHSTEHIANLWLGGASMANHEMYERTLARGENVWLLRNVSDGNFYAFPRAWFNEDYRRRMSS